MRNSAFKITVLLGIVGAGFWAILQAQNGLNGFSFSQKGETGISEDGLSAAPNNLADKSKKSLQKAGKSDFTQDPFAESDDKKVETASFEMQNKFSTGDDPFFKEEDRKPVVHEGSKKSRKRGLEFRDNQAVSPFASNNEKNSKEELPPWKGKERRDEEKSPFNRFGTEKEKASATATKTTEQPKLLFSDKSASVPAKLTLPAEAKAMPKREATGPQLVGLTEGKSKKEEDPFAEKSSSEKRGEDPFGSFEEQKEEQKPQKLPLIIPDEKTEMSTFAKEKNDEKKSKMQQISPLNLQEEGATLVKQKPGRQPTRLRHSPNISRVELADSKEQDLFGDGTIGSKSVPRGAGYPQLTIRKIAPKNATLGKAMVYKILVRNSGSTTAKKVIVEDHIPKGSKLTGTIPQAEMTGKRLTWKLGSMKPGEEKTIQIRVIPTSVGQIGSVALVNFVSEVAAETIVTAPKLVLTLKGPTTTTVGEPVIYKFRVTNAGTATAENVIIRNLIPKGLSHPDGNDLEYEVGSLAIGKSQEIKLAVTAITEGKVVNKAIATAKGGFKEEASVAVTIEGPILSITRSGPKHRYLGRPAMFNNNVKNESNSTIQQVTVVETVPDGFRFEKASARGKYNSKTGEITWQIGNLKPGETRRLSAMVTGDSIGTRRSLVKAYARNLLRAEVESQTVVAGYPKLQTSVAGVDEPVAAGEHVTYQIHINNTGTAQAENVNIALSIPAQLKFVSAKGAKIKELSNGNIQVATTQNISAKKGVVFYATFKAMEKGEGSVGVHAQGDHMAKPLTHEEAVIVYED